MPIINMVYKKPEQRATQGPAPAGFHVPLRSERQEVNSIRTNLGGGGYDGTNFAANLKLPMAGTRQYPNAGTSSQGSSGNYWASNRYAGGGYAITFNSGRIYSGGGQSIGVGNSIRPFKNLAVIPTSSRTKLYGTSIESGGIFWNSTDGLISLSSDGATWITIADKNLGATSVWNSGNTLSEANCGKYYQRGNNYGFLWTGSITTSSTQVDASNYGPGNYYDNGVFITNSNWDSSASFNLRGGEDGNVPV